MNRVIHAAVRRDLRRLEEALAVFPAGDLARAAGLQRAYANLHRELHHHHEGEDTHIFPMLARLDVEADLLAAMESEHQAMAEALAAASTALGVLAGTAAAEDARHARASVQHAVTVVERHLEHEERDLEPMLAPHLQTPEWRAVERQLRRQPVGVVGRFFAWVRDGIGEDERRCLDATVPRPVTRVLGRVAGRAYHREVAPVWRGA